MVKNVYAFEKNNEFYEFSQSSNQVYDTPICLDGANKLFRSFFPSISFVLSFFYLCTVLGF